MRPDYIPPQPSGRTATSAPEGAMPPPPPGPPLAAEASVAPNPADGLHGLMVPPGVRAMMRARVIARSGARAGVGRGAVRLRRLARAELASAAGRRGRGPGAFTIQAQMPDVDNIEPNSRVRVGDVTVGNVTKSSVRAGTRW